MDVSNSTGDSTGYRILGSGGVPPDTWKPKEGQDVYTLNGKKYVEVKGLLYELLAKGTLKPNTYVRLEMPDTCDVCSVEFVGKGRDSARLDISKLKKSGHDRLLVTLVPNGNGHPKPVLCRRTA